MLLMARFDACPNPGQHAKTTRFLLGVQSDLLDGLDSRMVIPLRALVDFPKVNLPQRLIPLLTIAGVFFLLETPKMGAVSRSLVKSPVASMTDKQSQITYALDFLFQGF